MQTFTPIQYLMIDIASNFGLDKDTWNDRLQWFADNEHQLDSLVEEAEEPALFYAGTQAYKSAKAGQSISYPISLDATASGAQLLSLLIGCEKSAKLCNVIDTGNREDLYTGIYHAMLKRNQGSEKIERKDTKKAIMTSLYGSTAQPKRVFGEGELLQIFYDTMEEEAPGIWALNSALLGLWRPDVLSHDWIMPDNFHVKTKVMGDRHHTFHFMERPYEVTTKENMPQAEGLSIGANLIHSIDGMVVREILRRCYHDADHVAHLTNQLGRNNTSQSRPKDKAVMEIWQHYLECGFLSARILDELDEDNIGLVDIEPLANLINSLPKKPFPVLAVHDCFRVHPNYGNDLRRQYNEILAEISASTMLNYLASQISGTPVSAEKFGDITERVRNAEYALS